MSGFAQGYAVLTGKDRNISLSSPQSQELKSLLRFVCSSTVELSALAVGKEGKTSPVFLGICSCDPGAVSYAPPTSRPLPLAPRMAHTLPFPTLFWTLAPPPPQSKYWGTDVQQRSRLDVLSGNKKLTPLT